MRVAESDGSVSTLLVPLAALPADLAAAGAAKNESAPSVPVGMDPLHGASPVSALIGRDDDGVKP